MNPAEPRGEDTHRSRAFDDACDDERGTIADFQSSLATTWLADAETSLQLPPISLKASARGPAELTLKECIGVGGMAQVFAATQNALGRTVAVKRLKDGAPLEDAIRQLVSEARLTGALEHPNIVPVYDLGVDGDGAPLLVMKRIEGVSWLDIIDGKAPPPDWASEDPLEWNVEILLKVCDALGYAHSRGIVHRDIKPSNVMVGAFGEVYLLDWGIAADIGDVPEDEEKALVGSPGYMCPEMLTGKVKDLVLATDVYLLGSTLHRCLVGQPRHLGEGPRDVWDSIYQSPPFDYGDRLPEELVAILHKAMNRYREYRYPTVAELRKALGDLLRHRGSVQLTRATSARLKEVEAGLSRESGVEATGLARGLGECEFGFRQALSEWPENRQATLGLQRTLELSLDEELRQGDVEGARRLLDAMPMPTPEARARVEALARSRDAESQEVHRLKAMARELSLQEQRPYRVAFAVGTLVIAVVGPLALALATREGWVQVDHHTSVGSALAMALPFWILTLFIREQVFANTANRALTYTALAGSALFVTSRLWGAIAGLSPLATIARDGFLFGVLATAAAIAADARFWLPVPAFFATAFAAAYRPDLAVELTAVGNLVAFSLIAIRWKLQGR